MGTLTNNTQNSAAMLRIKEIIVEYKELEKPKSYLFEDDADLYQANLEYKWKIEELQAEMDSLRLECNLQIISLNLFK